MFLRLLAAFGDASTDMGFINHMAEIMASIHPNLPTEEPITRGFVFTNMAPVGHRAHEYGSGCSAACAGVAWFGIRTIESPPMETVERVEGIADAKTRFDSFPVQGLLVHEEPGFSRAAAVRAFLDFTRGLSHGTSNNRGCMSRPMDVDSRRMRAVDHWRSTLSFTNEDQT